MNDTTSRRRLLLGVSGLAFGLAGCSGGGTEAESTPTPTATSTPTASDERLPSPVLGDPDAAVTLAVYEDFACPHCADYNENGFDTLHAEYIEPEAIRYEHRDAPIPVADPGSWQAASAARAVQARHGTDAFWNYAEKLFAHASELGGDVEALFERLASELGYDDAAEIATAGVERVHDPTVQADRQRAGEIGVPGTPAFVVDGEVVTSGFGSDTISTVQSALEGALSESA